MPLNSRPIAIGLSVMCFFGLSLIGWSCGLSPGICCKRAIIGSLLAYIAGIWAVKAVNAILMNAIITKQMEKQKQGQGDADRT